MLKIVILGTATNVPDADHENTHMVLVSDDRMVLIDGPGNPYSRLLQAGLDPERLTDIVVTHFHPDHAGGIPLLLMALGLKGRKAPLTIYTNQHCAERLLRSFEDYDWDKWHDFPVDFHILPEEEFHLCIETPEFRLLSSPVKHFIPAVGVRIEAAGGRIAAYSGDTAPTASLDRLAEGAQILIHEAAGASAGHASAGQAGEAAARTNVVVLYLVHYPVGGYDQSILVEEAKQAYGGEVRVAQSFEEIALR